MSKYVVFIDDVNLCSFVWFLEGDVLKCLETCVWLCLCARMIMDDTT
jgi:hypothetical protein